MSKILAFTFSLPGHINPFVPLLLELSARGHDVLLALCGEPTRLAAYAGILVREVPWSPELVATGGAAQRGLPFLFRGAPLAALLEQLIQEEHADFLLVDPVAWGGVIAAESSGLPWATLAHNPTLIRGTGVDVRGPGLFPPRHMIGRAWHRCLHTALRRIDLRYLATVNAVRMIRGLPLFTHPWDIYFIPPLILATTVEPFEYPRSDWPSSLLFIGPTPWHAPIPRMPWIDELDDRPLVLLVGSSVAETGDARRWVDAAVEGLANEPYQVIATLPTDRIGRPLPANIRVEAYVPHEALLPRAQCVVCHGGPGITLKALAAGVPVVAIPFALDRFEVSRRVQVAHAGACLPGWRLTPRRLKRAVQQAFACKSGAERVAASFRTAPGAPGAASAIESLARAWSGSGHV